MKQPKLTGELVENLKRPITTEEKEKKSATEKAPGPEGFKEEAELQKPSVFTSDITFLARRWSQVSLSLVRSWKGGAPPTCPPQYLQRYLRHQIVNCGFACQFLLLDSKLPEGRDHALFFIASQYPVQYLSFTESMNTVREKLWYNCQHAMMSLCL